MVEMLPPMLQNLTEEGSGGKNRPWGSASSLMRAVTAPGCTQASEDWASISMESQWARCTTQPPRMGALAPVLPVPRPRTVSGTRWVLARRTATWSAGTSRGRITASGMKL